MIAHAGQQSGTEERTGVYVYGIVPSDIQVEAGTTGLGDPPGELRVVRHGDVAALVSDVRLDRPLGRPDDLLAHEELLDASAAEVPVLPLRFGSVLASDDEVAKELLGPHGDEFAAALRELDGHAQYIVRGRYAVQAVLAEIIADDRRAAALRDEIAATDTDAARDQRIALGELVSRAIEAKRTADTRTLGEALADSVAASVTRPPTHEFDAVHVAFLVRHDQAEDLRQAVKKLAGRWQGRVELRLIGPLAAYDFVGGAAPPADPAG
jgi:hypothetical protein